MALMHPLLTLATLLSIGRAGYTPPSSSHERYLLAIRLQREVWRSNLPEKRHQAEIIAQEEKHKAELRTQEEAINKLASEEASSAQYYARITDADLEALTTRFNQEFSSGRIAATSLEKELLAASESQARERRGRDAETRDRHNRR